MLASLAHPNVKASAETLARALTGLMESHEQWMMIRLQLQYLAALQALIAETDAEMATRTRPFEAVRALLEGISGVKGHVADVILAEIGPNVDPFPSAAALTKWAVVAPGNKESAGKRLLGRTIPGNVTLRSALVEAALAAGRTRSV